MLTELTVNATNLAGSFGYVEQAKNQNFDHIPAAQWYVRQNGTSATAPVEITNREFFDSNSNNNLSLTRMEIRSNYSRLAITYFSLMAILWSL